MQRGDASPQNWGLSLVCMSCSLFSKQTNIMMKFLGGDILHWLMSVCESDSTNKPELILLIEIHHVISEGNPSAQDSPLALYK